MPKDASLAAESDQGPPPERDCALAGERVLLRTLTVDDVGPHYVGWMNDPDVARFLESRSRTWTESDILEFVQSQSKRYDTFFFAILEQATGRHVGNIKLGPVSSMHGTASVGLMIGERSCWGKGYGTEAIQLVCRHAFGTLDLRRITAGIYETNVGSIEAFRKAGFKEEGRQRAHWNDRGVYVDGLMFGLLKSEWQELRR